MKKQILFFIFTVISIISLSQSNVIKNDVVWEELKLPVINESDNQKRDIGDKTYEEVIEKKIYYKVVQIQKVKVMLFLYDITDGSRSSCHACTPRIDVATFTLVSGNWKLKKLKENWEIPQPGFGEGPKFQFKKFNNVECLQTSFDAFYNGRGDYKVTEYYNIETLKLVKSISKKISD